MTNYYEITPQADLNNTVTDNKPLTDTQKICLYIFFGCGVGAVIMASIVTIILIVTTLSDGVINKPSLIEFMAGLFYLVLFYPFAIIIGGVPALFTGLILNMKKVTHYEKLYAFVIGFSACLVFYFIVLPSANYANILLSILGGVAAAYTKRFIEKKEIKNSLV